MRAGTMLYLIALGWYIRYSGLDEDCMRVARDAWDLAVMHTTRVVTRQRNELLCEDDAAAVKPDPNWEPA